MSYGMDDEPSLKRRRTDTKSEAAITTTGTGDGKEVYEQPLHININSERWQINNGMNIPITIQKNRVVTIKPGDASWRFTTEALRWWCPNNDDVEKDRITAFPYQQGFQFWFNNIRTDTTVRGNGERVYFKTKFDGASIELIDIRTTELRDIVQGSTHTYICEKRDDIPLYIHYGRVCDISERFPTALADGHVPNISVFEEQRTPESLSETYGSVYNKFIGDVKKIELPYNCPDWYDVTQDMLDSAKGQTLMPSSWEIEPCQIEKMNINMSKSTGLVWNQKQASRQIFQHEEEEKTSTKQTIYNMGAMPKLNPLILFQKYPANIVGTEANMKIQMQFLLRSKLHLTMRPMWDTKNSTCGQMTYLPHIIVQDNTKALPLYFGYTGNFDYNSGARL